MQTESWGKVIEAVRDPFGVAALVVLALLAVALAFFRPASTKVRMVVFFVLAVLFAGFVMLAFFADRFPSGETLEQGEVEDPNGEPEQDQRKLAWDRRRGVLLGDLHLNLRAAGFEVEIVDGHLVPEVLGKFDGLVIATDGVSEKGFDEAELVAVEGWVRTGRLLVLADQAWHWVGGLGRQEAEFPLNKLASRFGVLITGQNVDAPGEVSPELKVPGGTLHREDWWPSRVQLEGSGSGLVRDRGGYTILAQVRAGKGLVVVAGAGGLLRDNPLFTAELIRSRMAMISAHSASH